MKPLIVILLLASSQSPAGAQESTRKIDKQVAVTGMPWYADGGLFPLLRHDTGGPALRLRDIGCEKLRFQPRVVHSQLRRKLGELTAAMEGPVRQALPGIVPPWAGLEETLGALERDFDFDMVGRIIDGGEGTPRVSRIAFAVFPEKNPESEHKLLYVVAQTEQNACTEVYVDVFWNRSGPDAADAVMVRVPRAGSGEPVLWLRGTRPEEMWDVTLTGEGGKTFHWKAEDAHTRADGAHTESL